MPRKNTNHSAGIAVIGIVALCCCGGVIGGVLNYDPNRTARPSPQTTMPLPDPSDAPNDDGDVYYADCAEVRGAGAAPIRRGDPGYSRKLDRDGDGVACE